MASIEKQGRYPDDNNDETDPQPERAKPRIDWQAGRTSLPGGAVGCAGHAHWCAAALVSGTNPLTAYRSLFYGAFGTVDRFAETLVKATPLLIIAVSVSICFRAQVWNIGAEGQLILGAITSTWVALTFSSLPAPLLLVSR